jgi:hypothetical protein
MKTLENIGGTSDGRSTARRRARRSARTVSRYSCGRRRTSEKPGRPAQAVLNPSGGAQPARRDRRFRYEAWQHSPYYDLIKNTYLTNSKQLTDIVEQAEVDERSKLQLRFYARQLIDA